MERRDRGIVEFIDKLVIKIFVRMINVIICRSFTQFREQVRGRKLPESLDNLLGFDDFTVETGNEAVGELIFWYLQSLAARRFGNRQRSRRHHRHGTGFDGGF